MRIARLGWLLLVAAGCEKQDPLFCQENPGATGCTPDGSVIGNDMDTDHDMGMSPDARTCFGGGAYAFCLTAPPLEPLIFNGEAAVDTSDSNTACAPVPADWTAMGQPDACFLVGTMISMDAMDVSGPRPLVLVSATSIEIRQRLDVAGHRVGGKAGPGSDAGCNAGTNPMQNDNGGGGGAGGSFMGLGGNGGGGNGLANGGAAGATVNPAPTRLRGGCPGQAGGRGQGGVAATRGGGGGGVFLVAGTEIVLFEGASINASGAGGGAPGREGGGAGGGSGGMIVLDAPMIAAQGTGGFIVANGGGGAAGEDDKGGTQAVPGNDPDPTTPLVAAAEAEGPGGDGASGATSEDVAQTGDNAGSNQGGGGGGGSVGYIQSTVTIANVTASPAIVVRPNP